MITILQVIVALLIYNTVAHILKDWKIKIQIIDRKILIDCQGFDILSWRGEKDEFKVKVLLVNIYRKNVHYKKLIDWRLSKKYTKTFIYEGFFHIEKSYIKNQKSCKSKHCM